ncbi:MAG: hypothetical protein HYZ27_03930 [Deltaproteobacteria bacterium]|nr:hypothetical protein [Deltaproteobacteria bacterium]
MAWAGALCNYHALLQARRAGVRAERSVERAHALRRQVQTQAAALGLKLTPDRSVEQVVAQVKARDKKVRSPVG